MSMRFPGMDPYIEGTVWPDFHHRAITRLADMLGSQLPADYDVNIEETVYIHELSADERRPFARPDVNITHVDRATTSTAVLEAPVIAQIPNAILEEVHAFLEIRDGRDRSVVTIIEILSPANKDRGGGNEQYLAKLRNILTTPSHFVEIDLLRGGHRTPWVGLPDSVYSIVVSRHDQRPRVGVWPVGLRERLPTIPVPIRDGSVNVDLQTLVANVYESTRYARTIYRIDPSPALTAVDLAWARPLASMQTDGFSATIPSNTSPPPEQS